MTGEPYEADYGFGWRITGDTLWHSGETIGFRNVIVRWPDQHLTVILLSNRNDPEPYQTALKIGALFLLERRSRRDTTPRLQTAITPGR